jgi:hypothetical protein
MVSGRLIHEDALESRSFKHARYSTGLDFIIPVSQEAKDFL